MAPSARIGEVSLTDKVDRRIKRTQKLLQEALIELTLEKGFDDVTIRDITDRADVGYTTFFRHYPDKEALLADVLNFMSEEFRQYITPHSIFTSPQKTGTLLFEYVRENRDLSRVLLNSTNTMALLRPVQEIGLQEAAEMFNAAVEGDVPIELAVSHLMTSLVMLIRWWLDHEMPYSPERMGEIAAELIILPVLETVQNPRARAQADP
jgi:AcrR family transcriptional regulator